MSQSWSPTQQESGPYLQQGRVCIALPHAGQALALAVEAGDAQVLRLLLALLKLLPSADRETFMLLEGARQLSRHCGGAVTKKLQSFVT